MFVSYLAVTALLLYICYTDARYFRIPNWVNALLLLLYPAMLAITYPWQGEFIWWHPLVLLAVGFAISLLLLAGNVMGAGDLKLLMVLSVWAGMEGVVPFLIYTGLYGGVLVLVIYMLRKAALAYVKPENAERLPQAFRLNEPVPYGIAIVVGFLTVLWSGKAELLPLSWHDIAAVTGF